MYKNVICNIVGKINTMEHYTWVCKNIKKNLFIADDIPKSTSYCELKIVSRSSVVYPVPSSKMIVVHPRPG